MLFFFALLYPKLLYQTKSTIHFVNMVYFSHTSKREFSMKFGFQFGIDFLWSEQIVNNDNFSEEKKSGKEEEEED